MAGKMSVYRWMEGSGHTSSGWRLKGLGEGCGVPVEQGRIRAGDPSRWNDEGGSPTNQGDEDCRKFGMAEW